MSGVDLEALGVYDHEHASENAYARVLLVGPAKQGKTTAVARTAPKPLIINCDGANATKGAASHGAAFKAINVTNRPSWQKAQTTAKALVDAGEVETVVVDTITLLADNLLDDISLTLEGFEKWGELVHQLIGGYKALEKLDAHLFVIAHMTGGYTGSAGILPAIPGSAKERLPAMVDDWILFDCVPGRVPERAFTLGPQGEWQASGRNIRRNCVIPAEVPALFGELGIPL